ncbi:Cytochrome c [Dirofilaria immitis]|nr:Cytochrome c [Dirofilaria immitis]
MTSNNDMMTKKSRIWNPALDDCYNTASNNKETSPVDFQNDHSSQHQQNLMQPYNNTIMQNEYSKGIPHHDTAMSFRLNITLLPNYLMNTMLNPNFTPFNIPNQNCCAVCGSIFRLTTDLVQHMLIRSYKREEFCLETTSRHLTNRIKIRGRFDALISGLSSGCFGRCFDKLHIIMSIPEGDYERGKKLFKMRCLQCHVIDSDANKNGPTLKGVIGRKSGTVDGYPYSTANKNKGVVWTRETLFEYLLDPKNIFRERRWYLRA